MSENTHSGLGGPQPPGEPGKTSDAGDSGAANTPSPHDAASPEGSQSAPAPQPAPGGQTAAAAATDDWLGRLILPAHESRNWLKFLGVVLIVKGVLSALTIVGLLFAWLPIWVGVVLWQAGDRATWAYTRRDPFMLEQYMRKVKTSVVICGVVVAVGIVLAVLSIGLILALVGTAALMEGFSY